MKVTLKTAGKEVDLDVQEDQTIAAAALSQGINLYGVCKGEGRCFGCSRDVKAGLEHLFNTQTRRPCDSPDELGSFVQTCKTVATGDGAVIDADAAGRLW